LRTAATHLDAGGTEVGGAAERVADARVDAAVLGALPAAQALATALAGFADVHQADLKRGAEWLHTTSDDLLATATVYEDTEQGIEKGFSEIRAAR
jgi:hypothetical protein